MYGHPPRSASAGESRLVGKNRPMPAADALEVVDFTAADPDPLLRAAAGRVRSGLGWVNLLPLVDDPGELPRQSVWASIFGAKGGPVPMCTWMTGSVGVQHGVGTKASATLAAAGIGLPDGWRVMQDSPRRGLVIELPEDTDPADVVGWLVRAGEALSVVETSGDWRAVIYG